MKKIIESATDKPPELRKFFDNSDELCEYMSDLCGGVGLLAFSRGKDSIVAWLKMRRYFKTIVPYFLYSIPPAPLSFEEKSLRYYEDYFGCHIIRLPHPALYGWWLDGVFQAPENIGIIVEGVEKGYIPDIKYQDNIDIIKECLPECANAYQASGVRSADSIVRRTSMIKNGVINHNKKTWFPVFDYKKADMLRELETAKIKLPIDYKWFGRTFDGIDCRFTEPLKQYSPEDFERVKAAYPLVEADLMRMEYRAEYWREVGNDNETA